RANQPTAVVVEKRATQQQMLCRWNLACPMRAAVARRKDRAALTEHPSVASIRKHRTHQTRVRIESFEIYLPPTEAAIVSREQIRPRFVIRFQLKHIAFCDEPARVLVRKVNIAQRIFR